MGNRNAARPAVCRARAGNQREPEAAFGSKRNTDLERPLVSDLERPKHGLGATHSLVPRTTACRTSSGHISDPERPSIGLRATLDCPSNLSSPAITRDPGCRPFLLIFS